MKASKSACKTALKRFFKVIGIGAAGVGLAAQPMSGKVFASQFLQDTTPVKIPENMVYDPELQLMVAPGTEDPIFSYSKSLFGDKDDEYQVAPLVTRTGKPKPAPTSKVTPGGGPNGPGPTSDSD